MPLPSFAQLIAEADRTRPRSRVVAIGGDDVTVIEALREAGDRGWAQPILTGQEAAIREVAREHHQSLEGFQIIDSDDPATSAVEEVRLGRADFLMKGKIATPDLMRAVLDKEKGLRTGATICQIVLMEVPRDDRVFLMADTGITIRPTIQQSREILESVIGISRRLGVQRPHVAVMAATEKMTDAMPETRLASELNAMLIDDESTVVSGPLSFDLAYSSISASRKGLEHATAGVCDAMLFPDLLSANLTVKAIMYTSDSRFGGILGGVACPVVFMSRSDDVQTRVHSLAFACAVSRSLGNGANQEDPRSPSAPPN